MRLQLVLVLALAALAAADVYCHNPRGSNNRLNEQSANRDNADRLFDSQNNNRGGYNVGDRTDDAFDENTAPLASPAQLYDYTALDNNNQYSMAYYEGSELTIEWTNQHGCGGNEAEDPYNLNCNIVLQYMCDTTADADPTRALTVYLKDGQNNNQPTEPNQFTDTANDANQAEGKHESSGFYYECKKTYRNMGLFHADQNLNGQDARYTRQNPNGGRRGLECPEERDYYPYWRPSPWKDIAVLTDHTEFCETVYLESQNVVDKYKCIGAVETNQMAPITQDACIAANANYQWRAFSHNLAALPECKQVGWSRANHLGNGRFSQPLTYNWTLPTFAGDLASVTKFETNFAKCVFRLRYNISTDDYDPWNTFSDQDDDPNNGVASPVTQNPTVPIGAGLQGLKLAINTAQFGRTFQDRSHIFYVVKKPATTTPVATASKIFNLNVRGKRGNIVQTYPAVEYDYVPNRLHIKTGDAVHVQWTGSNTHNNGNPGGDGQTGDAGEGTQGTDRHNLVQLLDISMNYPIPYDTAPFVADNIIEDATGCWDLYGNAIPNDWVDCAVILATSGQYRTKSQDFANFNPTLDDAPASLIGGVVLAWDTPATYDYMCTRNNNFSNRSQKATLIIGTEDVPNVEN